MHLLDLTNIVYHGFCKRKVTFSLLRNFFLKRKRLVSDVSDLIQNRIMICLLSLGKKWYDTDNENKVIEVYKSYVRIFRSAQFLY